MTDDRIEEHRRVPAPPGTVYRAVADLRRMAEWSPECVRVLSRHRGPLPTGARFVGVNRSGWYWWATTGRVVVAEPGREFAFDIGVLGLPVARWGYRFAPDGDGTVLTEYWVDRRGRGLPRAVVVLLGRWFTGVGPTARADHNRAGMRATLARIAAGVGR